MTISVVRRFTGADIQELEQQVLKGAAYINNNTDGTVIVMRNISGDSSSMVAVEEWDSLAAFEAGFQKLNEDPGWQALMNEASGIVSNRHTDFYSPVSP